MDLRIDFPTLPAWAANMNGGPAVIRDEITKSMSRLVIQGQGFAREGAPVDTGRLRNSIASNVSFAGGDIIGTWGTNVSYAPTIEEGRRPGAAMPPQGAVLGWMGRHGIDAALEFVIRRGIGRRGIKAAHFLRNSLDHMRPLVMREFSAGLGRAIARIGGGR